MERAAENNAITAHHANKFYCFPIKQLLPHKL